MVNQIIINSANLICRTTDISKYFRESLGVRDNESRLYFKGQHFTAVGVKRRMAAAKSLSVLHHSAGIIFIFLVVCSPAKYSTAIRTVSMKLRLAFPICIFIALHSTLLSYMKGLNKIYTPSCVLLICVGNLYRFYIIGAA